MLLQMPASGESWEDRMKMFHLSSFLCGVPKVPEVRRNHDGHLLSDGQPVTNYKGAMPNGGEAEWSAHQLYGGHWCMCHGEATEPCQDLSVKCSIAKTTLWWPREQK